MKLLIISCLLFASALAQTVTVQPTVDVDLSVIPNKEFEGTRFISMDNPLSGDFTIYIEFSAIVGCQDSQGDSWFQGCGLVDTDIAWPRDDFGVTFSNDGDVLFGVGKPDVTIKTETNWADGIKHSICATRKQSTGEIRLTVDGDLKAIGFGQTGLLDESTTLDVGRINQYQQYFRGTMQAVRLYDSLVSCETVDDHIAPQAGQEVDLEDLPDTITCTGDPYFYPVPFSAGMGRSFTIYLKFKTAETCPYQLGHNINQWWEGCGLLDADLAGLHPDFGITIDMEGKIGFGVGGGPYDISIFSPPGYNDDQWHSVQVSRNYYTGELKLVVDGDLKARTIAVANVMLVGDGIMDVCRHHGGDQFKYFVGYVSGVSIWESVVDVDVPDTTFCPLGWSQVGSQVSGNSILPANVLQDTTANSEVECRDLCIHFPGCVAFIYGSDTREDQYIGVQNGRCTLSDTETPTLSWGDNYRFCKLDNLIAMPQGPPNDFCDGTNYETIVNPVPCESWTIFLEFKVQMAYTCGGVDHWINGCGIFDSELTGFRGDWGISMGTHGQIMFGVGDPDVTISSPGGYNDAEWHTLQATRYSLSGQIELVIDGNLVARGTGSTTDKCEADFISICRINSANGLKWEGWVKNIRIFDAPSDIDSPETVANCPPGYGKVGNLNNMNDIPGWGITGTLDPDCPTIEQCATNCDNTAGCVSFMYGGGTRHPEYIDQDKQCELSNQALPTSSWGDNRVFCGKDVHNDCADGYKKKYSYDDNTNELTCRNDQWIGMRCDGHHNSCTTTACAEYCTTTFNCNFYQSSDSGVCNLYWGCDNTRTDPGQTGVTCETDNPELIVPKGYGEFDGATSYEQSNPFTDDFTIYLELQCTSCDNYAANGDTWWYFGCGLVDAEVPGHNDDYGLTLDKNGKVMFGIGNPDRCITTPDSVCDGEWHTIEAVRWAFNGLFYLIIDGEMKAYGHGSNRDVTAPTTLTIGNVQGTSQYYEGEMNNVAFYKAADILDTQVMIGNCAPGYENIGSLYFDNDIYGAGSNVLRIESNIADIETCGELCWNEGACKSFSYGGQTRDIRYMYAQVRNCKLMTEALPDSSYGDNTRFCRKVPSLPVPCCAGNLQVNFYGVDYTMDASALSNTFTIIFLYTQTVACSYTGDDWKGGCGLVDASLPGVRNDFGISINAHGDLLFGLSDTTIKASPRYPWAQHWVQLTRDAEGVFMLVVDKDLMAIAHEKFDDFESDTISIGRSQSSGLHFTGNLFNLQVYQLAHDLEFGIPIWHCPNGWFRPWLSYLDSNNYINDPHSQLFKTQVDHIDACVSMCDNTIACTSFSYGSDGITRNPAYIGKQKYWCTGYKTAFGTGPNDGPPDSFGDNTRFCQKNDRVPLCTGCGAREKECWEVCGGVTAVVGDPGHGLCTACQNAAGEPGACCRRDTQIDGDLCNSAHENWFISDHYHTCVMVDVAHGCTDPQASNYDSLASVDAGTCIYPGCTDAYAQNFDPHANSNDGSCTYRDCVFTNLPLAFCPCSFPNIAPCSTYADCDPQQGTNTWCEADAPLPDTNVNPNTYPSCDGNYEFFKCSRDCYQDLGSYWCLNEFIYGDVQNFDGLQGCKDICSRDYHCKAFIMSGTTCTLSYTCTPQTAHEVAPPGTITFAKTTCS